MPDCIFCKIAAGEIPAEIIHQDDNIIAFRDINPQAPQHILVIPREHIATVSDLTEDHRELAGDLVLTANKIAAKYGIDEDGYRLVFNCGRDGGQEVYHVHLHLFGGRRMTWPPG